MIEKTVQNKEKQLEHQKIEIRFIPETLQTHVSVLVLDRKSSIVVEPNDNIKNSFYEAMGLGT